MGVIFGHFGYLPFGWTGVQLFFVLSGFLITRILVDMKGRPMGAFFASFYARRALRIFPLYFGFLLVLSVVYGVLHKPAEFPRVAPWLFTYSFNFSNLVPEFPSTPYVDHLWSLAVEEQVYLVWPLFVFLLSRTSIRRVLFGLVIICPVFRLVLGSALRAYAQGGSGVGATHYVAEVIYTFTPAQIDAFAWGGLVAVYRLEWIQRPRRVFLIVLVAVVVAGTINAAALPPGQGSRAMVVASLGYPGYLPWHLQYVWGYTVINALAAAMVLCSVRGVPVTRLLEHPLLVRVGVVSYGMYVFHRPLLVLVDRWAPYNIRSAAAVGTCVVFIVVLWLMAEISYRLFEVHFLSLKDRVGVRESP